MQKPFSMSALVDTVENTEANEGLKTLMATLEILLRTLTTHYMIKSESFLRDRKKCRSSTDFSNTAKNF
jgi:hypothetical protein